MKNKKNNIRFLKKTKFARKHQWVSEYLNGLIFSAIFIFISACTASPQVKNIIPESELLTTKEIVNERHPLDVFFELKSKAQTEEAQEALNKWSPANKEEQFYKDFFKAQTAQSPEQSVKKYWSLYLQLKKSKKLMRLQLETLSQILNVAINSDIKTKDIFKQKEFKKEARIVLKKVKGLPEGLEFELQYLKWVKKNDLAEELCKPERQRWLAQTSLNLNQVMEGLQTCKMTFDDMIYRIRLLVFSAAEKKAQDELNDYIKIEKLEDWQKAYLQGVYFSNAGDPVAAFDIVKKFENEILETDDYYNNLFYIAQRAGELTKAEELINKIIKKSKNESEKNDFLTQKAFLFYQTRRYAEAIEIYDSLIKKHPSLHKKKKKSEFDDLTWLRAWCLYLNQNYKEAREAFVENKEWTRDRARNLYWLAQSEWALNNQIQAVDYYKQLAQPVLSGKFFNYYNYLAWIRFESDKNLVTNEFLKNQISLMKSGKGPYILPDDRMNPLKIVDEYKNYFDEISVTDEGDIQVVNQDSVIAGQSETEAIQIESSSQLKREVVWSDHLLKWGYADLAKWHLYDVEKSFKTRKSAEPLIHYYLDKKFYYRALSLMQKVSSAQEKKISLRDDELLWKSLYPKAYDLSVNSEAILRQISPYLVWSIMKAETQFKSDAISPVGAVGLMQFMPYTSQKVSQLLKEEKHEPKELFQPDRAIQHGAMYLKKLSLEFDGQLPFVAAAYNGGPHRVKLWLRNLKDVPFDVFVEHIPFSETRTYVKRVLSFYITYQKLYDEKSDYKKSQWLVQKSPYKLVEPISLKEEWTSIRQ